MIYLSVFLVSFTIALSGALAPGPVLTAVIYESSRRGAKAGPLMMLGHALLEAVMVALLILGIGRFINRPLIIKIISLTGAGVLFSFALMMFFSLPGLSFDRGTGQKPSSNLALLGITMSLANPYWTIWWVTIGLGLVLAAQKQGLAAVIFFFLGHILADISWYSIISLLIARGRKFFSLKIYKIIIAACATLLTGFAAWFALSAL